MATYHDITFIFARKGTKATHELRNLTSSVVGDLDARLKGLPSTRLMFTTAVFNALKKWAEAHLPPQAGQNFVRRMSLYVDRGYTYALRRESTMQ